ncbi:MAG: magnesium transporter [Syntrophothermaceae bacterium]|jgi:magnesium transporter
MEDILKLIEDHQLLEARSRLVQMNVVDVADFLENISREKSLIIFRILPKDFAADVFSYMSRKQQRYIVENITDNEIQLILDQLLMDDTIDFLEEMPANFVKKILASAEENTRELLNQLLKYPKDSAGTLMTIEYVDLKKEMPVEQALKRVRNTNIDKETIDICYVTDSNRMLEGYLPLRRLILNDPHERIENIMDRNVIFAHTLEDQEEVAAKFKRYDLFSMPVVDRENRLVGIITIDDILDIIEEEATEDFQRMAAMEPSQEKYLDTSVFSLAKHRVLWLMLLMISATFTGNIVQQYQDVLQSVVLLAAFIPMLMDTGGNAGSQSSTLIIRGLALGEITLKDTVQVMGKECLVGILVGSALALVNFLRLYYLEKVSFLISFTVCVSILVTVLLAKVIGGILPIIAKRLRLDPAMMAGPLITTIVDAAALLVYFSTATHFLNI